MALTITEALAEIKTIGKRIDKKRENVRSFLFRQERLKDPLEKEGGSRAFIASEMQGIRDLEERVVSLRRAIAAANASETITVGAVTRTIGDWLTWRREVAPGRVSFYGTLVQHLNGMRADAMRKGIAVTNGEASKPDDVVVNVDERALAGLAEDLESVLGTLDGQLSLKNATIKVEA